jgi:hypothetical protein
MYELNRYGKILINSTEIYYGCVTNIDYEHNLLKLYVIDWRDRNNAVKHFSEMIVPISYLVIKYEVE